MSRLMTKPNKMTVCPAKTQISLGIHPVWSGSFLCAHWVAKDPSFLHVDSEDWSDWAVAQADLSLRWAHMPFCWFCHEAAQIWFLAYPTGISTWLTGARKCRYIRGCKMTGAWHQDVFLTFWCQFLMSFSSSCFNINVIYRRRTEYFLTANWDVLVQNS